MADGIIGNVFDGIIEPIIEPILGTITPRLWLPSDTTTAVWLDGADDSTVDDDVSGDFFWYDKSGNDNDASMTTAGYQPLKQASGLNGLSTVRFDGEDDHLRITSNSGLEPATMSIFAVVVPTLAGTAAGLDVISKYYSAGVPYVSYGLELVTGNLWRIDGSYNGLFTTALTSATTLSQTDILSGVWNSNPNMTLHVDGTQGVTLNTTNSLIYNGSDLTIGSWLGGLAGNSFGGDIAEIILVSSAVDTSTRQKMEGYLAHKWGSEGDLPGGHPYKSAAPTA